MKAKKLLLSLLTALCFGFSALVITACDSIPSDSVNVSTPSDSSSEEKPHVHNYVEKVLF